MSVSVASTAATSDSGYDQSGPNYNYLSFFARGSYGRKLEQQRSRDPALARFEEEKKRWKWITGVALSLMALTNIVMATGLITWKFQATELTGSLVDTVEHFMKTELKPSCRPRYRKTKNCSQVAAQMFLVANPARDHVVWSDEREFRDYDLPTRGAFSCKGITTSKQVGKFVIDKESFYQIHSHMSFHSFPPGARRLDHVINRNHLNTNLTLAQENVTITHSCPTNAPSNNVTTEGTCFSNSLVATDQLNVGDQISILLKIDGKIEIDPLKPFDNRNHNVDLIYDGISSYFAIVKLGKPNNK